MASEIHLRPEYWEDAIGEADGLQLIVGGPGSGKTEFLARRAGHLLDSGVLPEELVLLSFSRRSAAELRSRVQRGLEGSTTPIQASTFHSLAMRIIESHGADGRWRDTPTLLTGPEQVALVGEALAGEDPRGWPKPFRPILRDEAFAREVTDFLLRASERLLGDADVEGMGRSDWRGIPGLMRRYQSMLTERGRIDYGTVQTEAVRLLDRSEVRRALEGRLRYVLVDEYQDTTVAQAALLSRLVEGGAALTVAGDPYQSIYSFRGAELSNIADFESLATGRPVRRVILSTSFRVPQRILDAAVRVTTGAGLPGGAGPMDPAGKGGAVETYGFDQHSAEAEWIASEIERIHLRGTPYERIAVMVRSKRHFLSELSRALERRRIPHDRPDARLTDHPTVRPVFDLVAAVTASPEEETASLTRVLLGPLVGMTVSAVRELQRAAAESNWDAALRGRPEAAAVARFVADSDWACSMRADQGFWELWTELEAFAQIVATPHRDEDRAALAAFAQALSRLAERDPSATLADYAKAQASEDFEATPLLEFRGDPQRVTLTTLHQSKGMSFDVVFIADAREGTLPDLRIRDSLIGARHLSPSHGGSDSAYARFRLQEERRLAYSAMCRASVRVVWTCTTAGTEGGEGVPSRFIPLVAGKPLREAVKAPNPQSKPTTRREAEAWLRRRAADPTLPLVSRLAAITALACPAPWRPRSPEAFAGIRERGPDSGLLRSAPVLSASQADSYRICPRRYAFERRLRIDRGGSAYQELGSLVHEALEIAEREAAARGAEHATTDEALAALGSVVPQDAFGGTGAWSEAWLQRAERLITRLYELWPGRGPGIGFEQRFEVDLAGSKWVGRIDRLEDRNGAIHIIDYKTSSSPPRLDEAARSMQLGLYMLGVARGLGMDPAGAEYWYPATSTKSVTIRSFDPSLLGEVEEALAEAAAGIAAEDWRPSPGDHCDRCSVRLVCPAQPQGKEAYVA